MISIVGNIKIDENKPERVKYLIACIRSYLFLKDHCDFILNIEGASLELTKKVRQELNGFKYLLSNQRYTCYGKGYSNLIESCQHNYIINFMEDQFMVVDSYVELKSVIDLMKQDNVDVCKSSFHKVELNSLFGQPGTFFNNRFAFQNYSTYYKSRYYIGCNFITTKEFAFKFWSQDKKTNRPHEYEIARFDVNWIHTAMVPAIEIQAAIDDSHGEPNTCLLERNDCEKWNKIWAEVNQ